MNESASDMNVYKNKYRNEVRGPKTTHPKEAALGRSSPHASYKMKDVWFSSDSFESEYLIVVWEICLHHYPQLPVRQRRLQPRPELRHVPVVVFQPSCIFHVKYCSSCFTFTHSHTNFTIIIKLCIYVWVFQHL